jgi:molybdenum cofactor cytidylyltransferase
MICLGDMPLIQTSTYTALMEAFGAADNPQGIVQPTFQGRRGQPVVFSKAYHDAILSHDEPEGCRGIVQDNLPHVQFVEINDPGIIQDIDDPETYMLLA